MSHVSLSPYHFQGTVWIYDCWLARVQDASPPCNAFQHLVCDCGSALPDRREQCRRGCPQCSGGQELRPEVDHVVVFGALRTIRGKPAAVGYDEVSRRKGRLPGEGNRKAIADAAICQQKLLARTLHRCRRKQEWNRGTGAHDFAESDTMITTGREIARPPAPQVVTNDSDGPDPMMQPIKCRALELFETRWY